ncbi:unnamed protein product [Trifolium pratense]|uniref:Uncharacterized protein n=1 Tax=Trifolium pratense TaxID=57577 RepID=A0ACB0KLH0_TRIPR|nr:unnamed protein product [Trifolium pratense]
MKPSRDVCSGNWIHSHETFSRCAGDDVEASFVWRDQHVAAAAAFPAHGGRASCPSALGHMSKGVAALSMDKFIQSRQRQENKCVEDFGDVVRE